jgi:pyruvate/2-oxoglutarate dehydrogenase complex dihydrolipoamide acyltransferase (E2) component
MNIFMEQIGDTQDAYTLFEWFYKEGDAVDQGTAICSVEVGKATIEVTAPRSGILQKIHIGENQELVAGTLLCSIG